MSADETRQKIIITAKKLFFEYGFNAVSVSEIIRISNTNKGSFYHHFGDKLTLAFKINQNMYDQILSRLCMLFKDNTQFENFFLARAILCRLPFSNEKLRRYDKEFLSSRQNRVINYLDEFIDLISTDALSRSELLLIHGAEESLTFTLISFICEHAKKLKEEETVRFYMKLWLGLYKIPSETVDEYLDLAYVQLSALNIDVQDFNLTINRK